MIGSWSFSSPATVLARAMKKSRTFIVDEVWIRTDRESRRTNACHFRWRNSCFFPSRLRHFYCWIPPWINKLRKKFPSRGREFKMSVCHRYNVKKLLTTWTNHNQIFRVSHEALEVWPGPRKGPFLLNIYPPRVSGQGEGASHTFSETGGQGNKMSGAEFWFLAHGLRKRGRKVELFRGGLVGRWPKFRNFNIFHKRDPYFVYATFWFAALQGPQGYPSGPGGWKSKVKICVYFKEGTPPKIKSMNFLFNLARRHYGLVKSLKNRQGKLLLFWPW